MGGWLVQVPVKRFGTEALVHLYAVWMPDHTDALAAVERQVEYQRGIIVFLSGHRGIVVRDEG